MPKEITKTTTIKKSKVSSTDNTNKLTKSYNTNKSSVKSQSTSMNWSVRSGTASKLASNTANWVAVQALANFASISRQVFESTARDTYLTATARREAQEKDSMKYKNSVFKGVYEDYQPIGPAKNGVTGVQIDEQTSMHMPTVEHVARAHNLVNRIEADHYHRFSRTPYLDPFTTHTTSREYIFITKPDLNLYESKGIPNKQLTSHSAFFADALVRYPEIAYQLQYSIDGPNGGPFMPILSNAFNGHVDVPGISADTYETANNVYGYHINYRGASFSSDYEPEVSIDFKDNKWLEVYMLLKMYDEYERLKWMGLVKPPNALYVYRKILYDQVTMYKIIVGEDGMSILYWARYVGGTLTSVPRDTFSDLADGEITFSTSWKFHFVEDLNPNILVDFNRISYPIRSSGSKQLVPLYDFENSMQNPTWPRVPYIMVNNNTDKHSRYNKYFLMWYD